MELSRRSLLVYGVLVLIWGLVVAWQTEEHARVRAAARTDLRNRSQEIASTLGAFIRGMRFRGTVLQERLEPVLNELVAGRTNELIKSSDVISIVLLNAAGEPVASAGEPVDLTQVDILQKGERWGDRAVTLVNPVDLGARMIQEGITNPTIVLPPFQDMGTNARPPGSQPPRRPPPDDGAPRDDGPPRQPPDQGPPREPRELSAASADATNVAPPRIDRGEGGRSRRPWWMRGMDDQEFQKMLERRAVHGLVLAMSTKSVGTMQVRDLWLRALIVALATLAVVGSGLAWRNLARSSDLQIRLVRASELNSHLRELNLAAAGLAHETRNPLNIIRGLAQMISKRPDADADVRSRSLDIINEADKVAAQLNEFINYSRPREVRRSVLALGPLITEVVRALNYDLEEKAIQLQVKGETLKVEADDQLLRQALFNLLLNAIQAVERNGEIQIVVEKTGATGARLEIRDNGPGVPPESRQEIFKPYFTMQEQGTGLGLAVVQQIVLAHGWEITCDANQPRGAVFRLSHLKVAVT